MLDFDRALVRIEITLQPHREVTDLETTAERIDSRPAGSRRWWAASPGGGDRARLMQLPGLRFGTRAAGDHHHVQGRKTPVDVGAGRTRGQG